MSLEAFSVAIALSLMYSYQLAVEQAISLRIQFISQGIMQW